MRSARLGETQSVKRSCGESRLRQSINPNGLEPCDLFPWLRLMDWASIPTDVALERKAG
jgi:hypothetical protein